MNGRCRCIALGLLAGFLGGGSVVRAGDAVPVRIGSKSFTESVVLGEMLAHLVRSAGGEPQHRAELGGTQIVWKALQSGEIDAYVEYTGTIREEILPRAQARNEGMMRASLAALGVHMSQRLGFNNTYAIGMRADTANRLGIRTIEDLRQHPDLRLGFSDEFMERADGWPGLAQRYRLPHQRVRGMDHNLACRGLDAGAVDVTDLYSTDAEIDYYSFRVLDDNRGFFPVYHAVLLSRADLAQRAPAVAAAFRRLSGQISTQDMIELNRQVKLDRAPESSVAAGFLNGKLGLSIAVPGESARRVWERRLVRLGQNTLQHLLLVVISLTAAILVAIPLGVAAFHWPVLERYVLGTVGVIQTLPSLALLVFMIPLLGLGAAPAIVALFLYSLLPIVRNTHAGLSQIAQSLRESAAVLGLPPRARLRLIELPLASPAILSGIKTAAVINVGTATIGALIGAGGYGQPILTGIRLDDLGLILQGAVPAAALAVLVQAVFTILERVFVPRGLRLRAES